MANDARAQLPSAYNQKGGLPCSVPVASHLERSDNGSSISESPSSRQVLAARTCTVTRRGSWDVSDLLSETILAFPPRLESSCDFPHPCPAIVRHCGAGLLHPVILHSAPILSVRAARTSLRGDYAVAFGQPLGPSRRGGAPALYHREALGMRPEGPHLALAHARGNVTVARSHVSYLSNESPPRP